LQYFAVVGRLDGHGSHFENAFEQKSDGNGIPVSQLSLPALPIAPPELPKSLEVAPNQEKKRLRQGFAGGAIFTLLACGILYLLLGAKQTSKSGEHAAVPILTEVWGPILNHGADVLVCVANQPSFSVHPKTSTSPSSPTQLPSFDDPGGRPMPRELYEFYRIRYPLPPGQELSLTVTTNSTYWGDTLAAMTALKTMFSAGSAPQLFPEKVITMPTLRRRNVILFGAPEYSPAIAHFLEKCPLTVNYLDAIFSAEPGKSPARLYAAKRDSQTRPLLTYGLITVLPSESSSPQQHRTVIFSGVNSAGTQAAAEFFTSPEHLTELKKQMNKDGYNGFPQAYQVVISSETDDNSLLNFHYETYRIIPALAR
ncbi:MAG TPA: hypothetical protein PK012_14910, partial [Blastocatellia bacterium]|nr:hypothetical protein [Blastocatellia bacterium]